MSVLAFPVLTPDGARVVFRTASGLGSPTAAVEGLVKELAITVVPFGEAEWRAATNAFIRFGRGRHPAALNFGDCLASASAAVAKDTLLFVGDDFGKTDITPAAR